MLCPAGPGCPGWTQANSRTWLASWNGRRSRAAAAALPRLGRVRTAQGHEMPTRIPCVSGTSRTRCIDYRAVISYQYGRPRRVCPMRYSGSSVTGSGRCGQRTRTSIPSSPGMTNASGGRPSTRSGWSTHPSATGTGWERAPWHAVQGAVRDALPRAEANHVIPELEALDVQLNGPATREGDPRHHELSHRNELLAGIAFLSVGWTALRS